MTDFIPEWDEIISDDGALLLDRLVRSLYRNKDGFLSANDRNQRSGVEEMHNAVCLYIYTEDENGFYTLNTYYVYGGKDPHSYEEWREIAFEAADELKDGADICIYGWTTTTIRVTPIRTGDLFICVDDNGVRGVRITFNSRARKHEAH